MFDIITIGSAVRDVFVTSKGFKVHRDPKSSTGIDLVIPLGSKLAVDQLIFETGGGSTNAAVTFARQDLKVSCICPIGEDPGGDAVLESLEKEGVDTKLVVTEKGGKTGYSIILVPENGERTVLVYRGASSHFTENMLPRTKLDTTWLFLTSLAGNITLLKKLVNWADKHGIKTALVPGSLELKKGKEALGPIFAKTDVVVMNREEAAQITGTGYSNKEKIVHKACLLTRGIGVITDGRYGATACDKEYFYHIQTHGNKPVDRTGAGDAFASGFVAGLIKYENVEGALELAADNASSVVNFFGAKRGILRSGEKAFKGKLSVNKVKIN
jgi:ribokinase